MASHHTWKFFRAGGFDQVKLETGADLMALDQLDQKLWVALACPTTGLEFDSKTLALIDTDKDGRIRAPELIAAAKWAGSVLKDPDELLKCSPELPLAAINESSPEGKQILASARHILVNLGKSDASVITLEDTADTAKIFAQTHFNGDGIIPADSAEDEATKGVINDIITCFAPEQDRSGKPGINQAKADLFFTEAQAYSDWWKKAETDSSILLLDGSTSAGAAAFCAVKSKIDDYFTRCSLAAFDPRAVNALNHDEKDYLAFTAKDLSSASADIAGLPLAQVAPAKPLALAGGLNPAWSGRIGQFQAEVVKPLLDGRSALTESDWARISARFVSYETWLAAKAGASVEKLGLPRIRQILAGKAKETIAALIARDKALEPEANAIATVERLIRYYRDLFRLTNNFVSFHDFYSRKTKAIFQAGTLYLDQRSCDLCITVGDGAKHAVMASLAGSYLAYCNCVRKGTGETMDIVAAFTDGDSDNLMAGRNGIFYDRKGRDWDATITRIVDNPISIRQAFWAPYKKVARMIQEAIAKRAAAADDASVTKLAQAATKVEEAATKGPAVADAAAAAAAKPKIDAGLIAALSVGAAGVGGMLGGIISGFLNLKGLMPIGVLAILLLVSGPSMLMAWLKLRRRNLGPILDANGWAVNAKAKINVPFGASLTQVAALPANAKRDLVDPFAEKKRPWWLYGSGLAALGLIVLVIRLAFGWLAGDYDKYLPDEITSSWILHHRAPHESKAAPGKVEAEPAPAASNPSTTPAK
jgi:hypothetical protein